MNTAIFSSCIVSANLIKKSPGHHLCFPATADESYAREEYKCYYYLAVKHWAPSLHNLQIDFSENKELFVYLSNHILKLFIEGIKP